MAGKRYTEIDKAIARRVRARRLLLGISQEKVAEALGVAFQQIQKYENGSNRISAGALYKIAKVLKVPLGFFFEDLDATANGETELIVTLQDRQHASIHRAFAALPSQHTKQAVLDLCRSLANGRSG
jgi:transcriptional regulator with XRE-family HTH domain